MGFNFSGLITKAKITNEQDIEKLTGEKVKYVGEVSFDDATSVFKEEEYFDLLEGKSGSLLITYMGSIFDISGQDEDTVQFILSDVSDTYYFEMVRKKEMIRKLITSQGSVEEDEGEGIVDDEDITGVVWQLIDDYLQSDINISYSTFKRFEII